MFRKFAITAAALVAITGAGIGTMTTSSNAATFTVPTQFEETASVEKVHWRRWGHGHRRWNRWGGRRWFRHCHPRWRHNFRRAYCHSHRRW